MILEANPAVIGPLTGVLAQLADLIESMSDEQYSRKPVGSVPSSVGGHVRHCLDHIDSVLSVTEGSLLDYDDRKRGTDVETDRHCALDAIHRQIRDLCDLPAEAEEWPLRLLAIVSPALPPVEVGTTLGRELVFVLSHTIHHNALVGVMAKTLGVPLPERFGYAPATLAHLEKSR